jgi:hypothetical protein
MGATTRREFLGAVPAAGWLAHASAGAAVRLSPAAGIRLEPFDYRGVRLRPSRWHEQVRAARDFYLALEDDDILHGCRLEAGLAAPGKPLGGLVPEKQPYGAGAMVERVVAPLPGDRRRRPP